MTLPRIVDATSARTLGTGDADALIISSGAAPTFTIPSNATAAITLESLIIIEYSGAGTFTFQAAAGVDLNGVTAGSATMVTGQRAFLHKEGTNSWRLRIVTPAGNVVGPASAIDNAIARFDLATGKLLQNSPVLVTDNGEMTLPSVTSPATPALGSVSLLATKLVGYFDVPGFIGPDGFLHEIAPNLGEFVGLRFHPTPNSATPTGDGTLPIQVTGTGTAANTILTRLHTMMRRIEALVTVAATTAVAGWRGSSNVARVGRDASAPGGFLARIVWGPATGVSTTTSRGFAGLIPSAAPTDVEPSSLFSLVGMGWDAADTNIQMMHNDGSGVATKIDLGASFPVPTADRTEVYELQLYSPNSLTQEVRYRVIRYNTTDKTVAAEATGVITTNLPLVSVFLAPRVNLSVGGTSSVIGVALFGFYLGFTF